ncbi:MAG: flagellar hook protein FlgE [Buchnera aphidicola (Pentalonia nigronervosa)]|jgi:flagellar hook protein FlgE|uniref:Flagellar hook protein FlgE n=1 Tax=Buchnera aphidicola (Pentalonia nigronervosa) TaxID=1309793 RepID=A0A7H1AZW3_9GAMM|nr:MAG: flagellar hook protein FlgE [Buchnera aphidicola (Pentalonia nigronervosa)]
MSSTVTINSLLVNGNHMDIISNNIANASTIGFKSSSPCFYNIADHSLYSHNTFGSGVGISSILQNFNNGTLIETGGNLDLGITKDGFFRILDSLGHVYYARNGQFFLDKDKNIINAQGMYLTGINTPFLDYDQPISKLEPINLKHADILQAKPTSKIILAATLNRHANPIQNENNSHENLSNEENYQTHIFILNKQGKSEKINISFNPSDKNTWIVKIKSNDSSIDSKNNNFQINFNNDGQLTSNANFKINTKDPKYDENLSLDLTGTIEDINIPSSAINFSHNGYPKGILKTFDVLPNGKIHATYSNQQVKNIGQIFLSKFINPEKLQPESGNMWSATANSGKEKIGTAGQDDFGVLTSKTLESSNVDLNKELINMIVAQRNYQSNVQAFKAEDRIINTLINLK